MGLLAGCGADAEERYAGLDVIELTDTSVPYRLRYLSPPWKRVKDDPLATGARKSVQVAGGLRDVVQGTALVLAIDRESSIEEVGLTYAKYVMEVAAISCAASELTQDETCAQFLAAGDYAARASREESGFFGEEAQAGSNDVGQAYYELMTRDRALSRYKRVAFFETADRLTTLRLYIEANPGLADPLTTRMIKTVTLLDEAGKPATTGQSGADK